ncbi:WxL domain-containing protein [Enterococcus hulanensis]|uniref:WxL domain-containing protein n=1 Tax=Enterococcus hulanensis TaxID=2559929 RepID=A0ABU3F469_9ENTE|nr:WxL domain-containing protein [Enterococcus hulanensis]MDT2601932.1 WxL domain-containing protein [Enterococcus hulanensis]MDT2611429.1 WxL domain-containing protein [Enterococcus hulanensis]MDT2618655.1 WxL domain-containing protein [Enterococcus hulanensis]MDT2630004.1 WxL domain-containing protein [Enterococcus hulanensis]MDT2657711.1 WxL domain-containing protein [Enterococcus hulanensis]
MKKHFFGIGILGLTMLFGLSSQASAEEAKAYQSDGVIEFIPSTDPIDPVDPENPEPGNPVQPIDPTNPDGPEPGTQGPLSIDYASSFDFGKNRISNKDQVYFARAQKYQGEQKDTPNYVQITDNRGTNKGWTLTIEQEEQLKAVTPTENDVLKGAEITLANPTVESTILYDQKPLAAESLSLVPGETEVVVTAEVGTGAGTWATYWGAVEEAEEQDEHGNTQKVNVTKDVKLSVPGETPKDAVNYKTQLTWTLTDVPKN